MAIDIYGATWCGDCRQAKNTLDKLGAAYTWHNIEEEEGAADRAVAISGQQHIPVVLYGDGSFQVEPSAVDIKNKLQELGGADRLGLGPRITWDARSSAYECWMSVRDSRGLRLFVQCGSDLVEAGTLYASGKIVLSSERFS